MSTIDTNLLKCNSQDSGDPTINSIGRITDDIDFPAAHSMDTMWFAVDSEGHVASFNSGEKGWVPGWWEYLSPEVRCVVEEFAGDDEHYSIGDFVTFELLSELLQVEPWRLKEETSSRIHQHLHFDPNREFMFAGDGLTSKAHEPLKGLLQGKFDGSRQLFSILAAVSPCYEIPGKLLATEENFRVLRIHDLTLDQYVDMHSSEACLGCCDDRIGLYSAQLARFGLFEYGEGDTIDKLYSRIGVPNRPIQISWLPLHLQKILQLVHLENIRFRDSIEIFDQPELLSSGWRSDLTRCWKYDHSVRTIRANLDCRTAENAKHWENYQRIFDHLRRFAESRGFAIERIDD